MKESEERSSNIDEQKARIRQRYKGIDPEELEVIPALPPEDIFKTEKKLRVAVYARVSTDDPRQTSSYELQKNHYQDVVNKNPNWMRKKPDFRSLSGLSFFLCRETSSHLELRNIRMKGFRPRSL